MKRCIRFIVHQRIPGASRQVGLFSAAYWLQREGELRPHDSETLTELLKWFEAELTVPPRGTIPDQAIFWYLDAGSFSDRMWELAHLVGEYGFTTELVTAGSVGRIVYQDNHQIAAVPRKRYAR
ncbi:MAG: hypothetical protein P4L84_06760 [Isosphaeraceae bacterium]|nr:hypothetical protein [Isosphaeraceae bacterium]